MVSDFDFALQFSLGNFYQIKPAKRLSQQHQLIKFNRMMRSFPTVLSMIFSSSSKGVVLLFSRDIKKLIVLV